MNENIIRLALPYNIPSDVWILISRYLSFRDFAQLRRVSYALHRHPRLLNELQKRHRIAWIEKNLARNVFSGKKKTVWEYCCEIALHAENPKDLLKKIHARIRSGRKIKENEKEWDPVFKILFNEMVDDKLIVEESTNKNALLDSIEQLYNTNIPTQSPAEILRREKDISCTRTTLRIGGSAGGIIFTGLGLMFLLGEQDGFGIGVAFTTVGGAALSAVVVTEVATHHRVRNLCHSAYTWCHSKFFTRPDIYPIDEESPLLNKEGSHEPRKSGNN